MEKTLNEGEDTVEEESYLNLMTECYLSLCRKIEATL